jgi:hypothetical protein
MTELVVRDGHMTNSRSRGTAVSWFRRRSRAILARRSKMISLNNAK